MIRRPVPWPNGAKVAVAITFDMDTDSLVHLAHPSDSIIRISTISMLKYGPEVGEGELVELPSRWVRIEKMIEQMLDTGDVWFARLEDIASHVHTLRGTGAYEARIDTLPYYESPAAPNPPPSVMLRRRSTD